MHQSDIGLFFDRFAHDFKSFSGRVISRRYSEPYLSVSASGDSQVFSETSAVAEYFQTVLDNYFAQGVRSCRYKALEVTLIGTGGALASVTWEMLRDNGTVQSSWRESYNLSRASGEFRIQVSTDHSA